MFAKRLHELRINAKLTQKELGEKLNLSAGTIGMYEQGRRIPDLDTLKRIADFFSIRTDYLLGRTNIKSLYEDFLHKDVNKLKEKINGVDPQAHILVSSILDVLYLLMEKYINRMDVLEIIKQIYYDVYHDLNYMDLHFPHDKVFLHSKDYINSINDIYITHVKCRKEINILLDNLFLSYLSSYEK